MRKIGAPAGLVLASAAFACSYGPVPPPCETYGWASVVFVGTVTTILETHNGQPYKALMRVEKVYKGTLGSEIGVAGEYITTCGGPTPPLGEPYLMYAAEPVNGWIGAQGVRNRPLKDAAADLQFLDSIGSAPPTSSIFGEIADWTNAFGIEAKPAVGALVKLAGAGGNVQTKTDAKGSYRFDNLAPGRYVVSVEQEGYRSRPEFVKYGSEVTVGARGCKVVNAAMLHLWPAEIQGSVILANGKPAPAGIDVTLLAFLEVPDLQGWERMAETQTDAHGQYRFAGVAPGRYKLAVNLDRFPTSKAPYLAQYWPAAKSEEEAAVIQVADQTPLPRSDFRMPPEPKSTVVHGAVIFADGRPAGGAGVFVRSQGDQQLTADSGGHFSFPAFEGFSYTLMAHGPPPGYQHSQEVKLSLPPPAGQVILLLAPAEPR